MSLEVDHTVRPAPILRVKRKRTTPTAPELGKYISGLAVCRKTSLLLRPGPQTAGLNCAVVEGLIPRASKRQAILDFFSQLDVASVDKHHTTVQPKIFQLVTTSVTTPAASQLQGQPLLQNDAPNRCVYLAAVLPGGLALLWCQTQCNELPCRPELGGGGLVEAPGVVYRHVVGASEHDSLSQLFQLYEIAAEDSQAAGPVGPTRSRTLAAAAHGSSTVSHFLLRCPSCMRAIEPLSPGLECRQPSCGTQTGVAQGIGLGNAEVSLAQSPLGSTCMISIKFAVTQCNWRSHMANSLSKTVVRSGLQEALSSEGEVYDYYTLRPDTEAPEDWDLHVRSLPIVTVCGSCLQAQ